MKQLILVLILLTSLSIITLTYIIEKQEERIRHLEHQVEVIQYNTILLIDMEIKGREADNSIIIDNTEIKFKDYD